MKHADVLPERPENFSSRRINAIAQGLGSQRYLEIGVSTGTTFHSVKIERRVAVDPAFKFDVTSYTNDATEFHACKSDEYFSSVRSGTSFDIYFIDGLHTFEQTLRDFNNAVAHSHNLTVWLLDDTLPTDIFSAFRNPDDTTKFRGMHGVAGTAWHGDVFKLVFFINDFFPNLNYRSIVGSGNTQTLVWRSTRDRKPPRFDDVERISRLGYVDLHDNLDVMRIASESEATDLCLRELRG